MTVDVPGWVHKLSPGDRERWLLRALRIESGDTTCGLPGWACRGGVWQTQGGNLIISGRPGRWFLRRIDPPWDDRRAEQTRFALMCRAGVQPNAPEINDPDGVGQPPSWTWSRR